MQNNINQRNYMAYREKSFNQRLFGHIGTVLTHKKYVRKACFKMGIYWQGIIHDLSKFSPTEFIPSVRYYSGEFSPNAVDKVLNGMSTAWLHHKGRNKHHFEYWIDYTTTMTPEIEGARMPIKYIAEMIADRYAACVAYNKDKYDRGDAWKYYSRNASYLDINVDTRAIIERALIIMRDEGENEAFQFMKGLLKITKDRNYDASIIDKVK